MSTINAFGKTICSICYEDLKPLIEDLQSISICGHVFHELCLQQWLEYCARSKKNKCPVCNQKCSHENVNRLYFQSVGDPNECTQRKVLEVDEKDSILLNIEVKKLDGKLSVLTTAFEKQQSELKEVNEQLCLCKEQIKKEVELKNKALQQKSSTQQLLRAKSEEFGKTSSECSRLQERNMALAKELAALKLVSDLNLDEEEVVKLASFGHGTNSKDTVDVLKKSLVLRNKNYKELMAQCNSLGRGESRSVRKLEKAKEKMKHLKTRIKELELALEEKENESLRALKASRKPVDVNAIKKSSNSPLIQKCSSEDQKRQLVPEFHRDSEDTILIDVDLDSDSKGEKSSVHGKSSSFGLSGTKKCMDNGGTEKDVMHNSSSSEVIEIPSLQTSKLDQSFAGGFVAPDGKKRFLGKWCKRNHALISSSATMQGSSTSRGDLIAVGSDGRGGTIKVLRSQNHSDVKGSSFLSKKCKSGAKQAEGHMQIDHFFAKANQS